MFFCNPCALAESHQQEGTQKLYSATLSLRSHDIEITKKDVVFLTPHRSSLKIATMISFSCVDLTSPKTYICLSAAFRTAVIPTTKQNKLNTDKKLDFSTGRVFVQCDKSENTKLSILIKYSLNSSA